MIICYVKLRVLLFVFNLSATCVNSGDRCLYVYVYLETTWVYLHGDHCLYVYVYLETTGVYLPGDHCIYVYVYLETTRVYLLSGNYLHLNTSMNKAKYVCLFLTGDN